MIRFINIITFYSAMKQNTTIMIFLAAALMVMALLYGCGSDDAVWQEECEEGECNIVLSCEVNEDCVVGCGCECVSALSECPPETMAGMCPIGGLLCGCLNETCVYALPQDLGME